MIDIATTKIFFSKTNPFPQLLEFYDYFIKDQYTSKFTLLKIILFRDQQALNRVSFGIFFKDQLPKKHIFLWIYLLGLRTNLFTGTYWSKNRSLFKYLMLFDMLFGIIELRNYSIWKVYSFFLRLALHSNTKMLHHIPTCPAAISKPDNEIHSFFISTVTAWGFL